MNGMSSDFLGPYLQFHKVPNLFDARAESSIPPEALGRAFGEYIVQSMPKAKIAILYQEEDFGFRALNAFYGGLGANNARSMITNSSGEHVGYPAENRVARVSGATADILVIFGDSSLQKFLLKQLNEISWRPVVFTNDSSVEPNVVGPLSIISGTRSQEIMTDLEAREWGNFQDSYLQKEDTKSRASVRGYVLARSVISWLQGLRGDLSPDHLMAAAKDQTNETGNLVHFDGHSWKRIEYQFHFVLTPIDNIEPENSK
jgi:branched-chain amino acid transport system substrate-binding protein